MVSESPILSLKSKSTSKSKSKSKPKSNSTPSSIHPTTSTSTSTSMSAVAAVDKSSTAYLKRREQVRRAQRTHRIRKESYIQSLESSPLTLRTQLREVEERNEVLEVRLRGYTRLHGSRALREDRALRGEPESADGGMDMDLNMQVGRATEGMTTAWTCLSEKCEDIDNNTSLEMTPQDAEGAVAVAGEMEGNWAMKGGYADLAMEFVLGLEKPCVQRAQALVFSPLNTVPTPFTTKRAELSAYHSFVENGLAHPELRDVSSTLQNLLTLSSAFCLEDEVTPIQAWAQLCEYFSFQVVDLKVLRGLVDALLVHVRCHGFGAVIERRALEETWRRVMM